MEVGILQKERFNMGSAEKRAKERVETDEALRTLRAEMDRDLRAMVEKTEAKVRAYHSLPDEEKAAMWRRSAEGISCMANNYAIHVVF